MGRLNDTTCTTSGASDGNHPGLLTRGRRSGQLGIRSAGPSSSQLLDRVVRRRGRALELNMGEPSASFHRDRTPQRSTALAPRSRSSTRRRGHRARTGRGHGCRPPLHATVPTRISVAIARRSPHDAESDRCAPRWSSWSTYPRDVESGSLVDRPCLPPNDAETNGVRLLAVAAPAGLDG